MRFLTGFLVILCSFIGANKTAAQSSCFNTGLNGSSIDLPCNVNCAPFQFQVPHLKSTSDYNVVSIPYAPFPFVTPTGNVPTETYIDDQFSHLLNLPFPVCFYDSTFTQFVIGSNGVITFDIANADCKNAWELNAGLPFTGTQTCSNSTGPKYPLYSIMGVYQDINPNSSSSPADRKIEWRVEGTAPCRKLVVSFYKVALFGQTSKLNTSQIVVHESTGIIDVFIQMKTIDTDGSAWNDNLAILGIQKNNTKALAAPGKNSTVWEESNTGYRFIPSGPVSRFSKAELWDMSGTKLAETGVTTGADTATSVAGLLDLNFPQQCPTGSATQYIVKTYYTSCANAANTIMSADTITINKTTSLNATTDNVNASACGPNGSFTVNIPTGAGTLPYTLTLDGGTPVTINTQSHTFTNLLGGNHTIVITTAGGCSQTLNVNVPVSGVLNVNGTSVPTSCNGAANGSVTLTPQNGVAPFQYSINGGAFISSPAASYTFNNLVAGNYFFSIKDASGCLLNNMLVIVGQGGPLTITATGTGPACAGTASGSVTITPTNGTAPYSYSINGGAFQPNNVYNNLATGTYFVSVKDALGCYVNNVFVNVPASTGSLNATATPTGTSCAGVNNGSINIVPTNGSAPYQYSINGGTTFIPGTSITGLAPGNYSVIVKDNLGCTSAPIPVTVSAGNSLLATTQSTQTSCSGVNNGTITITPTNGSGPYTYSLDGGTPQSGATFTNVSAGAHSVIVTDASGCVSAPISVTVGVGLPITGTTTTTATSCNGAVNGGITVTPTNGAAPYTYSLDGAAFQGSNQFTSVAAGAHTVIIKDAAGCVSEVINVTVASGAPLTGTAVSSATSCNGAADGGITLTPTNGNTPYQYSLDGITWQNSNSFFGLAAGSYNGYIRDVAGCTTAALPVSVAVGPPLTASVSTTPTSCSGAVNGTITVSPDQNAVYLYSIDGVNFQSSHIFTGLATGTYTITYKHASGCQGTVQATVNPGQPLSADVAVNNVMCNGTSTGNATVSISTNGAPPYQYSLDGNTWQASNTFSNLVSGSYTVYFKDQNNCTGTQSFNITQPTPLTISHTEQSALCNGQDNGNIMIAASGGSSPYQYSIDGTNWQSSNAFNVVAGNYTIYVKDNNDCIQSQVVDISEPALLAASTSTVNATCDGGSNGTILVNANGGTSGYQYSLDGIYFQSSNLFNVTQGSYNVIVKDANGCTTTSSAVVGLTNNLWVVPMDDTTICEGIGIQLEPNTNATQFAWLPAQDISATHIRQPIVNPASTTDYIVEATLGVCSANDTIRVNVLPAPIPDAGVDGDICYGQDFQLQGNGGVEFIWSPSTYLNTTLAPDPVVTPLQTIQYSLHVVDANGCRSLQADVVNVNVTPPIVVKISKDTVVASGDVFQLFASSVATDYSWSPSYGLDDPTKPAPMVTVTGDITYTVTATTSAGCKGQASVTLKVYNGPEIYVPTAFTPNGDGKNDVFKPFPVGIKNYTYFRVYNRWGQMIFASTDFNKGWDGTINGKTQPSGTYVWIVEGITKEDKKIVKRGTITLIR